MKKYLLLLVLILTACSKVPSLSGPKPIQNKEGKLTYFTTLRENIRTTYGTYSETPLAKHLFEVMGIDVEYIHPNSQSTISVLNVFIASGTVPDIIEFTWNNYPGGPEKAMDDGVVLPLNDYIQAYAPNYSRYLTENPDIVKMVTTQSDRHYGFPLIREDESLYTFMGPFIREDWLSKLSLPIPETISDWEAVLTAFKNELNVPIPFSTDIYEYDVTGAFCGAFGVVPGFYVEDGIVKHGALSDGYFEFLQLFRRWYENGLLDPNFGRREVSYIPDIMLEGKLGSTVQTAGSTMGKIQELAIAAGDNEFHLVGTPYPVLNRGERPKFGHTSFPVISTAISAASNNKELACKFLDFGYSDEGKLVYNFGIPDESYTMVDGHPKYTDVILNNPDYPVNVAMSFYIKSNDQGPFIQMKDYLTQYYKTPELKQALSLWLETDAVKHIIPEIGFSAKDSLATYDSLTQLDTYTKDKLVRFVMGLDDLETYPEFRAEMEVRTRELLAIYQQSYDKYMSR